MAQERFTPVGLSFNIGSPDNAEVMGTPCKTGGSYICDPNTKGCDAMVERTCIGTSCKQGNSAAVGAELVTKLLVDDAELESLHSELQQLVAKHVRKD